jgi:hypothetical protein
MVPRSLIAVEATSSDDRFSGAVFGASQIRFPFDQLVFLRHRLDQSPHQGSVAANLSPSRQSNSSPGFRFSVNATHVLFVASLDLYSFIVEEIGKSCF